MEHIIVVSLVLTTILTVSRDMDSNRVFQSLLLKGDSDVIDYAADPPLNESTRLLPHRNDTPSEINVNNVSNWRWRLFLFLEGKTPSGSLYESFTIFVILLSVLSFIFGTVVDGNYNPSKLSDQCGTLCDALFFGNNPNNSLSGLGIGATSFLEIFIVTVFTIDYCLRLYTADFLHDTFKGFVGRCRFMVSFFSLVDLISILPFYVDAFFLPNTDLATSSFLRMFRLLRMMKVEGRYDLAFSLIDDVLYEQRGIIGISLFVGGTIWGVLSSFYYLAERRNVNMIYCGAAPKLCFESHHDEIDINLCIIDEFGFVDCSQAGCPNIDGKESCWNVYRSIISASFWSLMNLFGEFPLVDKHSTGGMVVGTFTSVVAVAIFAVPTGIFASGFEEVLARRRKQKQSDIVNENLSLSSASNEWEMVQVIGDESSMRGRIYNFLHLQNSPKARYFDTFIDALVIGTSLAFMFETTIDSSVAPKTQAFFDSFDLFTVIIFTLEYAFRLYSARENPVDGGRFAYSRRFMSVVDFLSFAPYWIELVFFPTGNSYLVKWFRLFRILRFERYTKSFSTFDDVIRENLDVLCITGFSSILLWILFSSILYFTERNNPNEDMANYYKSVPHAMWVTLLNLSGECPLSYYSVYGKVIMGIIALWGSSAFFGITIGLLGSGFEDFISSTHGDNHEDYSDILETSNESRVPFEEKLFDFINGFGSKGAKLFETIIFTLIFSTVIVGIIQTIPCKESSFQAVEWIAAIVFTAEYILRLIAAGSDPNFQGIKNRVAKRLRFVFSFYSLVDLAAIIPFYLAIVYKNSWLDKHDEYLRMFRLLRLLKLDKYIPSFSLLDDVFRLKKRALLVSCYAAGSLLILFSGLLYIAERLDVSSNIDSLPLYGCRENCTMSTRYSNFFTSLSLTSIHLTGDFPIIEYNAYGRIVCFFIIIAAVGVVSIPSGLIASGFTQIIQSRSKRGQKIGVYNGDDWYDIQYRELADTPPPLSKFGPLVDIIQSKICEYLDGRIDKKTGEVERTAFSSFGRLCFFSLIITNVVAVIAESVPEIDRYVGNAKGNFFDQFEQVSVFFFTAEYILRLIAARKSRQALYSPWVYATTFFGLVDILSIAPWYIQYYLTTTGYSVNGDEATVFRILRVFRILQMEDFISAFSKLDNVFRASQDILKATGLMALLIWVGTSALFFIFEQDNPNFRSCDSSVPLTSSKHRTGCYDFETTAACNAEYPGLCTQSAFTSMPNTMFYVSVFLGGEWGLVDFTWQGKILCILTCMVGIALYAIPVGSLFDSFGLVIGIESDDDGDEEISDEDET